MRLRVEPLWAKGERSSWNTAWRGRAAPPREDAMQLSALDEEPRVQQPLPAGNVAGSCVAAAAKKRFPKAEGTACSAAPLVELLGETRLSLPHSLAAEAEGFHAGVVPSLRPNRFSARAASERVDG
ncbi:hypothetical protein TcYC6_0067420 [Trypanosoma cruzi]|nr:hypothetical protein TcYC6_0067420 [Trypanosoma cruzi]